MSLIRHSSHRLAPSALSDVGLLRSTGLALLLSAAAWGADGEQSGPFRHVATFAAHSNSEEGAQTSAEIVAASQDGHLIVYTDSALHALGFVDLSEPAAPKAGGHLPLQGEPTSVAVAGPYALVVVNTRASYTEPSGDLVVIDLARRAVVHELPLGGQPDSIAVSPDGRYAAIAIENERDEELGDGEPPQLPAGYLVIVDLVGAPAAWTTREVRFEGLPMLYADDPEPEFVDINDANVAAVTLQENNHIALVDLASGQVTGSFSAGAVDLVGVDTVKDGKVDMTGELKGVLREPDAVAWLSRDALATANEGDLHGGSRGFTIWSTLGEVLFDSGADLEHEAARIGRYPEGRAGKKGTEPEGAEFALLGGVPHLFIGAERASVVFVYRLERGEGQGAWRPVLVQSLPTGVGPEGLIALPSRGLLVVGCEVDDRAAGTRGGLDVFQMGAAAIPDGNVTGTGGGAR